MFILHARIKMDPHRAVHITKRLEEESTWVIEQAEECNAFDHYVEPSAPNNGIVVAEFATQSAAEEYLTSERYHALLGELLPDLTQPPDVAMHLARPALPPSR